MNFGVGNVRLHYLDCFYRFHNHRDYDSSDSVSADDPPAFMESQLVILGSKRAQIGSKEFLEILEEKPIVIDSPKAVEPEQIKGRITFENVTFAYDSRG